VEQEGSIVRGFIIGVLLVAVGVLGYLYWDAEHNTLIKAPGVEIKMTP
jgi:predicted negative regulator of RcsB-dependent stress response